MAECKVRAPLWVIRVGFTSDLDVALNGSIGCSIEIGDSAVSVFVFDSRRLFKVEHSMLCGELDDLKARLQTIGLSGRINTSFVERIKVSTGSTQA